MSTEVLGTYALHHVDGCPTVATGCHFTITNPKEPHPSQVLCYRNPDVPGDATFGQVGFGFNLADGAGFLPLWHITKDSNIFMTFGQATEAAKKGYKVCRKGWNGADMFLHYVEPGLVSPAQLGVRRALMDGSSGVMQGHWIIKTATGEFQTWAPSSADSLAEDWEIYSPE